MYWYYHVLYRDAGMTMHAAMIDQPCTDAHEKMCGCEASKCGGKVPPSKIWFGRKSVFCAQWVKKNQSGWKFLGYKQ
jgi:hypothetical protein